jgi:hypothetical protein
VAESARVGQGVAEMTMLVERTDGGYPVVTFTAETSDEWVELTNMENELMRATEDGYPNIDLRVVARQLIIGVHVFRPTPPQRGEEE